jgi:cystathionine beta-lyase
MNKPKDEPGLQTILSHCGRNLEASGGYVNVPPYEGSTIIHDDMDDLFGRVDNHLYGDGTARTYGTDGGPTHEAFYEAMNKLEGGVGTWAFSTGLAGCTIPMMAFLKTGDHMLVTDSVYGPTRQFCEVLLKNFGVEAEFYGPTIGAGIEGLIRPNTRLIYMESPGTHTFEMQDVPAIAAVARRHGVVTMIDNTYATPINFQPLKHGVDVVVHSATKYICGHSDVLMSTVTCNEKTWKQVRAVCKMTSAQSVYLGLRGLHTLKVRLDAVGAHTRKVVDWLLKREEVKKVIWPAYEKDPGYPIYKRDFAGPIGLFAFQFQDYFTDVQINRFMDSLKLFGLGYSWGGFESLILRSYGKRTVGDPKIMRTMIRVYIGLEDPQDMINDLDQAMTKMRDA